MKRSIFTSAMLASVLVAGPAMAQNAGGNNMSNQQSQNQASQSQNSSQNSPQQSARNQPVRINGQMQSVRTATVRDSQGNETERVLGKVQTRDGQIVVIDLGERSELESKRISFSQGGQIQAEGQPGRFNGKPVMLVYRYNLGKGSQQTARSGQSPQSSSQQQGQTNRRSSGSSQSSAQQQGQSQQLRVVQGEITNMQDVNVRNIRDQHRLIKVQTQSGQNVIADLGTGSGFQDINLQTGDRVMLYGQLRQMNGRPVLFTRAVAEVVTLDRSNMAPRARMNQQGQSGSQQN